MFIYIHKNEPLLLRRATHCHLHFKLATKLSPCTTGRTGCVSRETCMLRSLSQKADCASPKEWPSLGGDMKDMQVGMNDTGYLNTL